MKIKSFIEKYLIPHQKNEYQPHALRQKAAFVMLAIILLAEAVFLASISLNLSKTNYFAAVFPSALIEMANEDRLESKEPELKISPLLNAAAKLKAEDMASKSYFSHNSPDGRAPWYWINLVGYNYSYAGENLAINFVDSKDVNNAWMNSPTHRANIMNGKFTEIGIGMANGFYQGKETTFVVQLFGRPVALKTTPQKKSSPPVATTTVATTDEEIEKNIATRNTATTQPTSFAWVKGESVEAPNFSAWILSSPHTIIDLLYFGFVLFLFIATALAFFVNIKVQHPLILRNGLSLVLIIVLFIIINKYLSFSQAQIF